MVSRHASFGVVRAPEFPPGLDWLNTDRPLRLADLRGKIVLLDFWTYGCINCMHVIPDLKRLEEKYADELVVIGVHSAKFRNEGETENLRQIVLRYEVEHPVVNDRDFAVWQAYAVRAWPTLVLIDPRGRIVAQHSGERVYEMFDPLIGEVIDEFEAEGGLDRTPLDVRSMEWETYTPGPLSFPGKLLADLEGVRLFISDTNYHRVVLADLETGTVDALIGRGVAGLVDGDFATACFRQPQGLALGGDGRYLYVADTGNHALRRVDLSQGRVETIAGTGEQSRIYPGQAGRADRVALNSPWDVALVGQSLYVAMAGPHQIWRMDLREGTIAPFAGSGAEGLEDGPLSRAQLAQPSGLAPADGQIYFADAEASAVRVVDLERGQVHTLVGSGLFDFGDVDGVGVEAQLQHALGVAWDPDEGYLYVADTYNNKIKRLNPLMRRLETVVGGLAGYRDGAEPLFYEPGGLSLAGRRLYVADTNNHAIRVVDLPTRTAETFNLGGLEPPVRVETRDEFAGTVRELPQQQVSAGAGLMVLQLSLPPGYKLTPGAPSQIAWSAPEALLRSEGGTRLAVTDLDTPLRLPVVFGEGQEEGTAQGDLTLYYCRVEQAQICLLHRARFVVPLRVVSEGKQEVEIDYEVSLPER